MSEPRDASPIWSPPPVLEGRLVRLEPLARRHVTDLVEAASDPAVWRWTVEDDSTDELMQAHLERAFEAATAGSEVPFATVRRADGRAVGGTRFLAIAPEHRRLEIGWTWLTPALWGRGLNDEAKLLQLAHAFDVLGCRRVEFKTDSLNERSRAALLGIGATFEGIFRNHMVTRAGRTRHSAWYSIIDAEWPSVRQRLQARVDRWVEAGVMPGTSPGAGS